MMGIGRNPLFVIKYDGFDQKYKFRIMKHLANGVLKLISVHKDDFVGARILHKLNVGDCCQKVIQGIPSLQLSTL